MRNRFFALILLGTVMAGCLKVNYAEKEQVLSLPDGSSLTLEAEVLGEDNVYKDVVTQVLSVRANRSWSAVIQYEGTETGWLELSEEELLNLHEYSVDEPVILTALRNEQPQARRASIVISSDASHKIILPVEQKAQVRFLEVETDRNEVLSVKDTVTVAIRSNTAWTAVVDDALTTAGVKLSVEEGKDYGLLKIAFAENFDATQAKTAVVTLAADGVTSPLVVELTQRQGAPYIEFRMDGGELSPEVSRVELKFGASVNWSLRVKDQQGMDQASFSQETGGPTSTGDVVLNLPLNGEDPGVSKQITIELSAPGLEPQTRTFTQKGCIHLDFLDVTAPNTDRPYSFHWPFASPAQKEIPASVSAGTFRGQSLDLVMPGGHVFTAISEDYGTDGGIWYNNVKQGFHVGKGKGSCLEFPAIEGLRLKTVVYEPSYLIQNKVVVTDAEGNIVPGGELWISNGGGTNTVEREMMENHYFHLEDTQPNTRYRIASNNNGLSVNFKDLVLIYE